MRTALSLPRHPFRSTYLLAAALGGMVLAASARDAAADFRICNTTPGRVGVAVGYKDDKGWATEGWWNIGPNSCETVLRGELASRYYYVYAIDYDHGGEWAGEAFMCTQDQMFTIRGINGCEDRGYQRTGFFEIDTQEQTTWTVQLQDPSLGGEGTGGD
ncbi:DUF1036 domain-containing protein [Microbaculum sp. FT89]|uniref:DUF1036 domain-containing protein n=1 Tax=Microbaculum sp. FT89 TaxID=3447298 RepID=UPI003F53AE22